MPLNVKNWSLRTLWHLHNDNQLDLAPDYQRREAWNDKKRMVLIDSLARRVPINAITVYESRETGALVYEVIDGKQRLTALIQFLKGELVPLSEAVKDLSEEEEDEGRELAEKILDKGWSELDRGTQDDFRSYEVPIYVVNGPRAAAVRAFRRMNADPYALNPQEIRNAVFKDSAFLHAARSLSEKIEKLASGSDHFLVEWGVMSTTQWSRMQDIQFLSELLCLCLARAEAQEARRTLDGYYDSYSRPTGSKKKALTDAVDQLFKIFKVAHVLLGSNLKAASLDGEHHVYAMVGALLRRGIPTTPQMSEKNMVEDVQTTLAAFGDQVVLCQAAIKESDEKTAKDFAKEVREYAATFLGGQVNSANRREGRIKTLLAILKERVAPIDARSPSELQRKLVWARSATKECARCHKKVDYKDYDCGHNDAKAFGGRAVLSNLRVEHRKCNRAARAK